MRVRTEKHDTSIMGVFGERAETDGTTRRDGVGIDVEQRNYQVDEHVNGHSTEEDLLRLRAKHQVHE